MSIEANEEEDPISVLISQEIDLVERAILQEIHPLLQDFINIPCIQYVSLLDFLPSLYQEQF